MQQTTKMTNHFLKSKFLMVPSPPLTEMTLTRKKHPQTVLNITSPRLSTHSCTYFMMKWWNCYGVNTFPLMYVVSFDKDSLNFPEWTTLSCDLVMITTLLMQGQCTCTAYSQQVSDIWSAWASFSGVSVYFLCLLRFPVFMRRIYLNYHVFWHSHTLYINYGCNYLLYRPLVCGLIILKQ